METRYAFLAYDVPTTRRSAYNTLRRALRRIAVPTRTWSCYLINFARRDEVDQAIAKLNEDQPKARRIRYDIALFDGAEDDQMEKWVFDGIVGLIKQARSTLTERIERAQKKLDDAAEAGEEAGFTMGGARRISARKAKTTLNDARVLAEQFQQTNNLVDSFSAFLKVVEAEEKAAAVAIEAQVQAKKEAKEAAEKPEAVTIAL